ncbi:hypothetical protein HDU76_008591, partial [Blyttiomyces sp. JEL0837]
MGTSTTLMLQNYSPVGSTFNSTTYMKGDLLCEKEIVDYLVIDRIISWIFLGGYIWFVGLLLINSKKTSLLAVLMWLLGIVRICVNLYGAHVVLIDTAPQLCRVMDPVLWKFAAFRICAFFGCFAAYNSLPSFWEEFWFLIQNKQVERRRNHATQGEAIAAWTSGLYIFTSLLGSSCCIVIVFTILNYDTAFEHTDVNNLPNDNGLVCSHKVTGYLFFEFVLSFTKGI